MGDVGYLGAKGRLWICGVQRCLEEEGAKVLIMNTHYLDRPKKRFLAANETWGSKSNPLMMARIV